MASCTRLALIASILLPVASLAQTWELVSPQVPRPSPRMTSMAHDPLRQKTVLFGGNGRADTWEWDGTRFEKKEPAVSPPFQNAGPLVFDSARGKVMMFSGASNWYWDGETWTQVIPATSPPPRDFTALADDAKRGVVVLFGGVKSTLGLDDLWEWNGTTWTSRTTGTKPSARWGHGMVFDPMREVVLLQGGTAFSGTPHKETWEWSGTAWKKLATATYGSGMDSLVFDPVRARPALFAENSGAIWTFDGADWVQEPAMPRPPKRANGGVAFDIARGALVLFGGQDPDLQTPYDDLWTWNGTAWIERIPPGGPQPRRGATLAWDVGRGRLVLFGGVRGTGSMLYRFSDTWEFDGTTWHERSSTNPKPDYSSAAVWEPARQKVVLIIDGESVYEWNGSAWTYVSTAAGPTERVGTAYAYDPVRQRIVSFGGRAGPSGAYLDEQWELEGATWTQSTVSPVPPARTGARLAYDASRSRLVLFGGSNGSALSDTWEFDGTAWTEVTTTSAPSVLAGGFSIAWEPALERVVLYGTETGATETSTFSFDGAEWTKIVPLSSPIRRSEAALTFDPSRGQLVAFGGRDEIGEVHELWAFDPSGTPPVEMDGGMDAGLPSGADGGSGGEAGEDGGVEADGGTQDGGSDSHQPGGCGCSAGTGGGLGGWPLLVFALLATRRRLSQRPSV
jgi:MYXO-CTERM domain-containing protein